jgi:hypothetical protein
VQLSPFQAVAVSVKLEFSGYIQLSFFVFFVVYT